MEGEVFEVIGKIKTLANLRGRVESDIYSGEEAVRILQSEDDG